MLVPSPLVAGLVGSIVTGALGLNLATAASNVKVMSLNVRTSRAPDPCPVGCWEYRQWRFKTFLESISPDFLAVQETAPDQVLFIQTQLGYASTGECAGECQSEERNSIFYKADRFRLLTSQTFALSDTPAVLPSNTWNLEYLRAAVVARFLDLSSNVEICMLNTHYDISRGQNQSSVLVANLLKEHCQFNDAVFMTGDLNHTPEGPAVQYLLGNVEINNQRTPFPLYETLTAVGAGGPTWIGPSFGVELTGIKFDYILARAERRTCLLRGAVLAGTVNNNSISDHAAVLSEFCLGDGCTNCVAQAS